MAGEAAYNHAMDYLKRSNQLEFKTAIFNGDELEHAEKWQFRNNDWYVSDFGGEEMVDMAEVAFRHFAQAVRTGNLQVESGTPETADDKVIIVNAGEGTKAEADKKASESTAATQGNEDDTWAQDKAVLEQIIAKTHPLMAESDLEPILTAYYQKYKDDAEKNAVVMDAIQSWQDFAVDLAMKTIAAFKN